MDVDDVLVAVYFFEDSDRSCVTQEIFGGSVSEIGFRGDRVDGIVG